jgi:hypothetical protein
VRSDEMVDGDSGSDILEPVAERLEHVVLADRV